MSSPNAERNNAPIFSRAIHPISLFDIICQVIFKDFTGHFLIGVFVKFNSFYSVISSGLNVKVVIYIKIFLGHFVPPLKNKPVFFIVIFIYFYRKINKNNNEKCGLVFEW